MTQKTKQSFSGRVKEEFNKVMDAKVSVKDALLVGATFTAGVSLLMVGAVLHKSAIRVNINPTGQNTCF